MSFTSETKDEIPPLTAEEIFEKKQKKQKQTQLDIDGRRQMKFNFPKL